MVPNDPKQSKIILDGPKWSKVMKKNGQKCQKWSKLQKMVKIAKNGQNRQKWSKLPKMVKNGQKWPKWSKSAKMLTFCAYYAQ